MQDTHDLPKTRIEVFVHGVPRKMTLSDTAKMFGVSSRAVQFAVDSGKIPFTYENTPRGGSVRYVRPADAALVWGHRIAQNGAVDVGDSCKATSGGVDVVVHVDGPMEFMDVETVSATFDIGVPEILDAVLEGKIPSKPVLDDNGMVSSYLIRPVDAALIWGYRVVRMPHDASDVCKLVSVETVLDMFNVTAAQVIMARENGDLKKYSSAISEVLIDLRDAHKLWKVRTGVASSAPHSSKMQMDKRATYLSGRGLYVGEISTMFKISKRAVQIAVSKGKCPAEKVMGESGTPAYLIRPVDAAKLWGHRVGIMVSDTD